MNISEEEIAKLMLLAYNQGIDAGKAEKPKIDISIHNDKFGGIAGSANAYMSAEHTETR